MVFKLIRMLGGGEVGALVEFIIVHLVFDYVMVFLVLF